MLVLNQTENTTEGSASSETEFTLGDLVGFSDLMKQLDILSIYSSDSSN